MWLSMCPPCPVTFFVNRRQVWSERPRSNINHTRFEKSYINDAGFQVLADQKQCQKGDPFSPGTEILTSGPQTLVPLHNRLVAGPGPTPTRPIAYKPVMHGPVQYQSRYAGTCSLDQSVVFSHLSNFRDLSIYLPILNFSNSGALFHLHDGLGERLSLFTARGTKSWLLFAILTILFARRWPAECFWGLFTIPFKPMDSKSSTIVCELFQCFYSYVYAQVIIC